MGRLAEIAVFSALHSCSEKQHLKPSWPFEIFSCLDCSASFGPYNPRRSAAAEADCGKVLQHFTGTVTCGETAFSFFGHGRLNEHIQRVRKMQGRVVSRGAVRGNHGHELPKIRFNFQPVVVLFVVRTALDRLPIDIR